MGPCLCGDTECPWCGPLQGGGLVEDQEDYFVPDPETPHNCDVCGKVLERFYKDNICRPCLVELDELKRTKEWKYPYARED